MIEEPQTCHTCQSDMHHGDDNNQNMRIRGTRPDTDGMTQKSYYISREAADALDSAVNKVLDILGTDEPRHVALSAIITVGASQVDRAASNIAHQRLDELFMPESKLQTPEKRHTMDDIQEKRIKQSRADNINILHISEKDAGEKLPNCYSRDEIGKYALEYDGACESKHDTLEKARQRAAHLIGVDQDDVKLAIDNIHVGKRWIIATIFDDGRMPS